MYGHKYSSKKEKWVSNGCGGQVLKRTYSYNRTNDAFASSLLCFLFAAPFFIARNIKERRRFSNHKSFIERLEESQQRSLEKLQQTRRELWNTIKNKRESETEEHWIKKLKRYGFTPDGVHTKTRINSLLETREYSINVYICISRSINSWNEYCYGKYNYYINNSICWILIYHCDS